MNRKPLSGRFSWHFWLTMLSFAVFSGVFWLYVVAEKQVDTVNDQRFIAHELCNELMRTSEDLTRFARAYVLTGRPEYRRYFTEITETRDGKRPALPTGEYAYHDLTPAQSPDEGGKAMRTAQPLLQRLRAAGMNDQEFELLLVAKTNSDILTRLENQAMNLVEMSGPDAMQRREQAMQMLHGDEYRAAKQNILVPIEKAHRMMSERLNRMLSQSIEHALQLRLAFLMVGLLMLTLLWRSYRQLQQILGAAVPELQRNLAALGRGDFTPPAGQAVADPGTILGGIQACRLQLAQADQKLQSELAERLRINQMYLALAQCNQSILRITEQEDLFPRICQDAVILAGLKYAWVLQCDHQNQGMRIASEFGSQPHFAQHAGAAIATNRHFDFYYAACQRGEAFWYTETGDAARGGPWQQLAQDMHFGAIAALPLLVNHEVAGCFVVCAENPAAFDEVVRTLLSEFTSDVGHVLNRFALEEERRQNLKIEELRAFLLQKISDSLSLQHFMEECVIKIESLITPAYCSVLLLDKDGMTLRNGAAPSLPVFYCEAIDGLTAGPGVGSCGNAVATGRRTIAEDLSADPYWQKFWPLAQRAGLRSCWSEPVFSASGQIYGTFAVYHTHPGRPSGFELRVMETASGLLALAIEHRRSLDTQRKLAQAVEQSSNAILITDAGVCIEYANTAYLQKTGCTLEEVRGAHPRILSSGKTHPSVYQQMWQQLQRGESWTGELMNKYADGSEHVDLTQISPIRDTKGHVTHFLAIQEDITDKKRNDERIRYLAHYDLLTGLPNRGMLEEWSRATISQAERNQAQLALIFLDLDHFKDVNDTLGHSAGDSLLIEVASRLRKHLREEDLLSRLGGDEFIILLAGAEEKSVEKIAQKMIELISAPFHIGDYELQVTPSIGIALYPDDGKDLETLLRNADAAMYRAKNTGRNTFSFFTQEMQLRSARHLELVSALRHAIAENQLSLHYQPQISLSACRLAGAEALLRWQHPVLGNISPAEFIPVAEESGLITEIGEWVLHTAMMQLAQWRAQGLPDFCMAVNLSAVQFKSRDLPALVQRVLQKSGVPAGCLELELTESVAMHDPASAIAMMNQLHALGLCMSIDDFGTGYSSLNYLKQFKVYKLKIDQSFVRDVTSDPDDEAIIGAIISMAHKLGMITIAEGVETQQQLDFLREQGCDEIQGYLFSRPLPAPEFLRWVQDEMQQCMPAMPELKNPE